MKKLLALLAIVAVIGIIILADRGLAAQYFGFLYGYPGGDAVAHFLILGTLTFLVTWAFPRTQQVGQWNLALAPLVILTLISIEEISQGFIPGRTLSLVDWLANFSGIVVGGALGRWLTSKEKREKGKRDVESCKTFRFSNRGGYIATEFARAAARVRYGGQRLHFARVTLRGGRGMPATARLNDAGYAVAPTPTPLP